METKEILNRVRDLFGEVYVGGSYAVNTILNRPILPESDIDFYIKNRSITRYMLKDIIEKVLFKGLCVRWDCKPEGDHLYYKMPGIHKKVSCTVYEGASMLFSQKTARTFDFMLVENLDAEYLLREQASTATMCCLALNFSFKGYGEFSALEFKTCHREKVIYANTHEDWCTNKHLEKLHNRYPDYIIKAYSSPRLNQKTTCQDSNNII